MRCKCSVLCQTWRKYSNERGVYQYWHYLSSEGEDTSPCVTDLKVAKCGWCTDISNVWNVSGECLTLRCAVLLRKDWSNEGRRLGWGYDRMGKWEKDEERAAHITELLPLHELALYWFGEHVRSSVFLNFQKSQQS